MNLIEHADAILDAIHLAPLSTRSWTNAERRGVLAACQALHDEGTRAGIEAAAHRELGAREERAAAWSPKGDFQIGVDKWMDACFGDAIKADMIERADQGDLVERVDREAAANLFDELSDLLDHNGIGQVADLIRDGEYDEHEGVQAFVAHRRAAIAACQALHDEGMRTGIEAAAMQCKEGADVYRKRSSIAPNKRNARDYESMAIACVHAEFAIRAIYIANLGDA